MLIRKKAPLFIAEAIAPNSDSIEKIDLNDYVGKNGVVIFFYPKDFTYVCPTEIIAFNNRIDDFHQKGFNVIGISVDSIATHQSWVRTPIEKGGIGKINFPLVSDENKEISKKYDVLCNEGDQLSLRGSFLIDKTGIVRHCVINDFPLGRSIDEMLRMIDALDFTEKHGEVCPANWKAGKTAIKPNDAGISEYLKNNINDLK